MASGTRFHRYSVQPGMLAGVSATTWHHCGCASRRTGSRITSTGEPRDSDLETSCCRVREITIAVVIIVMSAGCGGGVGEESVQPAVPQTIDQPAGIDSTPVMNVPSNTDGQPPCLQPAADHQHRNPLVHGGSYSCSEHLLLFGQGRACVQEYGVHRPRRCHMENRGPCRPSRRRRLGRGTCFEFRLTLGSRRNKCAV